MPYQATVYNVMIASPGDVPEEREAARKIILDWNNIHSATRKIVLLPLGWEHNSSPTSGNRPQEIINDQILTKADILVGIFWTRIGTPTGLAASGTVEEISEHIQAEKPAMLYFSKRHTSPDVIDHEQYEALKVLKKEYRGKALTEDFNTLEEFTTKFRRHLDMELNKAIYSTQVNSGIPEFNDDATTILQTLSYEAKRMLKLASRSASATITKVSYLGGTTIEVNGFLLFDNDSPREGAKWERGLKQLIRYELIEQRSATAEIFPLTDQGFSVADQLEESFAERT